MLALFDLYENINTNTNMKMTYSLSDFRLPPLDGPMLSELQHIQGQAPEFFYSLLKSEMEFTVIELLKFSRCLRNLTR